MIFKQIDYNEGNYTRPGRWTSAFDCPRVRNETITVYDPKLL